MASLQELRWDRLQSHERQLQHLLLEQSLHRTTGGNKRTIEKYSKDELKQYLIGILSRLQITSDPVNLAFVNRLQLRDIINHTGAERFSWKSYDGPDITPTLVKQILVLTFCIVSKQDGSYSVFVDASRYNNMPAHQSDHETNDFIYELPVKQSPVIFL